MSTGLLPELDRKQECARLAANRAIGEVVRSRDIWFKTQKRHEAVVISFGLYQIAHVDTDVSERKALLPEWASS